VKETEKMMSFQLLICMKIWRYIYFRGQASDRNAVQGRPVLNFHMVGTAVGGRPILFNTCLDRLSYLKCVVYALPYKGSLNILIDFDTCVRIE
jgi:hypothetical protein